MLYTVRFSISAPHGIEDYFGSNAAAATATATATASEFRLTANQETWHGMACLLISVELAFSVWTRQLAGAVDDLTSVRREAVSRQELRVPAGEK